MSSPFSTLEEFNGVLDGPTEGAIYTFADAPIFNNIALLASVGIFIWFIAKTYSDHTHPLPMDNTLTKLSTFIVVSLLSLVAFSQERPQRFEQQGLGTPPENIVHSSRRAAPLGAPLGLLGMMGVGMQTAGSAVFRKSRKRKKARSLRHRPKR